MKEADRQKYANYCSGCSTDSLARLSRALQEAGLTEHYEIAMAELAKRGKETADEQV